LFESLSFPLGKTLLDALIGEVLVTCEKLTWLANAGEQYLISEKRDTGRMMIMKKVKVEFVPLGVIGAIVPWNYPFHNVFNPVSAALFSGNIYIHKYIYVCIRCFLLFFTERISILLLFCDSK
jgi:acyl-CoA reductase-like NAD-dependent aldehyde dehydrogenase